MRVADLCPSAPDKYWSNTNTKAYIENIVAQASSFLTVCTLRVRTGGPILAAKMILVLAVWFGF